MAERSPCRDRIDGAHPRGRAQRQGVCPTPPAGVHRPDNEGSQAPVSNRAVRPYEGRLSSQRSACGEKHSGWRGRPRPESNRTFHPFCRRGAPPGTPQGRACPRLESNQRPRRSERRALSAELRGHGVRQEGFEPPQREGTRVTAGPGSPTPALTRGAIDGIRTRTSRATTWRAHPYTTITTILLLRRLDSNQHRDG